MEHRFSMCLYWYVLHPTHLMDKWITCNFTPFLTVVQLCQNKGRTIMQWNPIYSLKDFHCQGVSKLGIQESSQWLTYSATRVSTHSNVYCPKEFKPNLYFSHRLNTKTYSYLFYPNLLLDLNCRTKFPEKKQSYHYSAYARF